MKSGEIKKNRFFSLIGEALKMLHEAEKTKDTFLKNCLISSSILAATYSLEAAANSALETIEPKLDEKKYTTLEKFEKVLLEHTGKSINKGCMQYQNVARLILLRNEYAHPKIFTKPVQYESEETAGNFSWSHQEIINTQKSRKENVQKIPVDADDWSIPDIKLAIKAIIDFLNIYICEWWGIDRDTSDYIFLQLGDVSVNGEKRMYDLGTLKMLKLYDSHIKIRFINIPSLPEK